jgi:predicted transcriptional regulator
MTAPGSPTVAQVMKPTATIEPGAHLAAATYLIRHSHDPALVVMRCDNQIPLATLAYSDIAKAIDDGRDPENSLVKDVAAPSQTTVQADVATEEAARLMRSNGVERLPVLQARRLVGIVELTDCCGGSP